MTWSESVDEAICFGWIDGVRRSIDDEGYCIRFTPRNPKSNWSAVNIKFKPECGRVPVVEQNGDFYACDHFVEPEHHIGNIRQSSLSEMLESTHQKLFGQAKLDTLPGYCLNCEVLKMCNGACPKDRFIDTPEGEPNLNYLCEGYKMFFNHCKPFVEEVAEVWGSNQSQ